MSTQSNECACPVRTGSERAPFGEPVHARRLSLSTFAFELPEQVTSSDQVVVEDLTRAWSLLDDGLTPAA